MTSLNLSRYSRRKWSLAFPAALVAAAASVAYGDFGPPQGGGGGGAAQTPWTSAIDAAGYALSDVGNVTIDGTTVLGDAAGDTVSLGSTNRLAFGGTSSTYPAMRYGSSAGVIELLRADGSAGSVEFLNNNGNVGLGTYNGNTSIFCGTSDKLTLSCDGADSYIELQDGTPANVALVGSSGLSIVGDDALAIKDVTSAPSVTAGYQALYGLNQSGTTDLMTVVGGTTYHLAGLYSDWTSVTLTCSWTTNTTTTCYIKRIGDTCYMRVKVALTGAPNSTNLSFTLPTILNGSGDGSLAQLTVDTAKSVFPVNSTGPHARVSLLDNGTAAYEGGAAFSSSTTFLVKYSAVSGSLLSIGGNDVTQAAPFTWASGDQAVFEVSFPVVGW